MSMSSTSTITNISNTHKNNHINHNTHRISNGAQACAACKYQRRKCAPDCILAPYFPHDRQKEFLHAHKLFGVSNITKIIRNLNPPEKDMAMRTIIFQSDMRAKDPVGGCYRIIQILHQQIEFYKSQLDTVLQQIALCRAHQAAAYQQQQQMHIPVVDHDHDDNNNNDDPTTSSYEILQEFNDHQNYEIMPPIQDNHEYVNAHQQQEINQQQLHENDDDVGGGEVLNHHNPQHHVQDFQYSWSLQDSVWIPSKGSCNREGSPVEGDHDLALEDEAEAFQQHPIPEHDLRSAATLFTLTS